MCPAGSCCGTTVRVTRVRWWSATSCWQFTWGSSPPRSSSSTADSWQANCGSLRAIRCCRHTHTLELSHSSQGTHYCIITAKNKKNILSPSIYTVSGARVPCFLNFRCVKGHVSCDILTYNYLLEALTFMISTIGTPLCAYALFCLVGSTLTRTLLNFCRL